MREARTQTLERLRALCAQDPTVDIAEAALLLSAARQPALDLDPYRQHLATLVAEVADLVRRRRAPLESLRQVLAVSYGYRGDRETYDDLRNADLAHVIDRRKGLPVALSVIWMHVARAQAGAPPACPSPVISCCASTLAAEPKSSIPSTGAPRARRPSCAPC